MVKDIKVIIKFVSGNKLELGMTKDEYIEFSDGVENNVLGFKKYKMINIDNIEYIEVKGL